MYIILSFIFLYIYIILYYILKTKWFDYQTTNLCKNSQCIILLKSLLVFLIWLQSAVSLVKN